MNLEHCRKEAKALQRAVANRDARALARADAVLGQRLSRRFLLSDAQMARLAPLLPRDTRGVPRVDDRRVISGIVHVLRSGCRWADAPGGYGPYKTLYNRFVRWAAKGGWERVFFALAAAGGPPAEMLLDSSTMKAHRCAAGAKGGSGRRRLVSAAAAAPPRSTRSATNTVGRAPST